KDRNVNQLCFWPGPKLEGDRVPRSGSYGCLAKGIYARLAYRVNHLQPGATVGSYVLRTHEGLQQILVVGFDRNELIRPGVSLIPAHCEVPAHASITVVRPRVRELDCQIRYYS